MKKAPLIHLVKCEFILFRKDIILSVLTLICIVFICVMFRLSMEIGNLALLPFEDKQMMNFWITYIPIFFSGSILNGICEGSVKETGALWKQFRLATPVSNWRLALAKYVTFTIMFAIAIAFSFGYIIINSCVRKETQIINEMAVAMVVLVLMLILEVVIQVLILYFGSLEKVMFGFLGTFFSLFVAGLYLMIDRGVEITFAIIEDICVSFLPYSPIFILVILAGGFVATAQIYKRREK